MSTNEAKLYHYHVENMHSIEIALKHSSLAARKAISEENYSAIKSFTSLKSFLIGAWAENRLNKLLYENMGFTSTERKTVLSQSTKIDQWIKLVELAFRKHFSIPKAALTENTLPFSAYTRYKVIIEIIDSNLRSVIEIRNKLAHGQWIYPLNNKGTKVESEKYKLLKNENLPSLQYKESILKNLSDIIHDLVVSKTTFERDFDLNYRKIINTRNNLNNRSYDKYANQLIEKRKKGKQYRNFK